MKFLKLIMITVFFLAACGRNHHLTDLKSLSVVPSPNSSVQLSNPGNVFLGKPVTFTGLCSSSEGGGDVTVTIAGVTPSALNCPCVGGTFTCPVTTYNTLPSVLNFDVSYSGASSREMGFGSCPPGFSILKKLSKPTKILAVNWDSVCPGFITFKS